MSHSLEYLKRKSYLTRRDKVFLAVVLILGIPVVFLGFPYFVIAGTLGVFAGIAYAAMRLVFPPHPPKDGHPARVLRLDHRLSPPTEIKHGQTIVTVHPASQSNDERPTLTGERD